MQNGQPVSKASIAFLPTDGKGREDFAVLEGGEYKIDLIPGKYKVVIEPEWVRKASKVGRTTIPTKYQDATKTDLTADVEKAKDGLDFDLK